MVITYKTINKIRFPVYTVGSSNWELADGLLFIDGEVVDDKNMPGSSLGIRRLETPHPNLYRLNKQLWSIQGILKQNAKNFIDSNGNVFIYEKTMWSQLKYYKIKRIERKEVASVLWLHGINFPITIPRPPASEMMYAGLLHYQGLPWVLYEYSEDRKEDTRRKV